MSAGSSGQTPVAAMPQLDALRAFAVAAVLLHHFSPELGRASLIDWGFLGVRLFFVLSGFLITGILIRAREDAAEAAVSRFGVLRSFYARRFLRIFPLYYFVIVVCLMLNVPPVRDEWIWLVTYTWNLRISVLGWYPENVAHFWSLAVEEQFYLVWPLVALFAPRRFLMPTAISMVLIGMLYRGLAMSYELNEVALYVLTFSTLDALGAGCALALACDGRRPSRSIVRHLASTALPIGLCAAFVLQWAGSATRAGPYFHVVLFDTAAALVFCWLVAASAHGFKGVVGRMMNSTPLLYCGRIAYGIYVYHLLLLPVVDGLLKPLHLGLAGFGWMRLLVGTVISIAVATLSWYALERPINELKRRFPYLGRGGLEADSHVTSALTSAFGTVVERRVPK